MKKHILFGLCSMLILVGCNQNTANNNTQTNEYENKNNNQQEQPQPQSVQLGMISMGDNGMNGQIVGCGDSLIFVNTTINTGSNPLEDIMSHLVSLTDPNYGQSGLANTLANSNLSVTSASVNNGLATINLSGSFQLGGVCDNPRVKAQLEQTAMQVAGVSQVQIYLNGVALNDVLSGQ